MAANFCGCAFLCYPEKEGAPGAVLRVAPDLIPAEEIITDEIF